MSDESNDKSSGTESSASNVSKSVGSKRSLSDWISYYLEYTSNTEAPTSYHYWTAMSLIAGALQRKCHIKWGHARIYPNMYIILVGPSGRTRKGVAMDIGKSMFEKLGLTITADSLSKEQMIAVMQGAHKTYIDELGHTKGHCSIMTFSKELSVLLGQRDIGLLADLTDWYDSTDVWRYETKGKGTFKINGMCYNLLGATAPDWIKSMLPAEAIGGGFTARIIFVVEDKKGKTVELPTHGEDREKLRILLELDLKRIADMAGEFIFTKDALEAYADWYRGQDADAEKGFLAVEDPHFASYCERRATHIKKISMSLSASRSSDMSITVEDFNRAKNLLEKTERKMPLVFGGVGNSFLSDVTNKILIYLVAKGSATKQELLSHFYRDIGTLRTFSEIIEILTSMRAIEVVIDKSRKESYYKYIGDRIKRNN